MRRGSSSLYVIELVYKAPLEEIDAQMRAHMQFLRKQYSAGRFLVSGRKLPRDGGVILAATRDRAELEAVMREDPFCARGLAAARVIEFRASQLADDLGERLEAFAE